ncbi:putative odorant receptor 92a isoform X2 [Helicoverpa zea]|uniref:putative odorant receptor 92a isoform X2 n=1 Tax=Helicoverpa zea TaxID=7113 RepID=UPI001F57B33D|nr:putative odorant receptor 92a isoform X2 [Helicoverpa zea]
MLCGDLLFCIFLSHITTQFDLLAVRVRRLVYVPVDKQLVDTYPLGEYCKDYAGRNKEMINIFDDNDWEVKHQRELSDIIVRHRALIRLSGDVENMFSFALLVNFFNSSIIICFCGFCCVIVEKWNEFVYKSFLTTALSQTWPLCWYGQRLLESGPKGRACDYVWIFNYFTSQLHHDNQDFVVILHFATKYLQKVMVLHTIAHNQC